jgi:predicted glycoside hydrolase/deacetylase ChbG (UPF0249 family)
MVVESMRVIITADDFGYDISRNLAIAEAFSKNLCTQTSIMVNMDACEHAVEIAKKEGFADCVGLHINLTIGKPLTENIKYISDICTDGMFNGKFHHNLWKRFSKKHMDIVKQEIEAQFIRFLEYNFSFLHMDSHHWIHLDRKVAIPIRQLLEKYKFLSYRRSENIKHLTDWEIVKNKYWYRHFSLYMNYYDKYLAPSSRKYITANYVGRIHNLQKASTYISLDNDRSITIEFITHPIYKDDILFDKGVAPLEDMINLLRGKGYSFITYNHLIK